MNRVLSIASIIISLAALALSIATYTSATRQGPTQEEMNRMIVAELDARDRARIAVLAPKAKAIYSDMLTPEMFDSDSFAPTTYEELFKPMMVIITQMTTQ